MLGKFRILVASSAWAILPAIAAAAANPSGLEEVVVTARKVTENIQKAPVSVTVVTSKMLDAMSIANISQIDHLAPNLQYSPGFSGSSSGANFYIRGIGQTDFISTSDPGVSLYLDGVYVGRTMGAALDAADIERVEVLKGPQGTLFGKNTIGGAINVVTKRPSNESAGYVEGTLGNYQRMDARFSANVPLSDSLFARISGVTRNNDGFAQRVKDGVRVGDDNDVAGRVQLLWTPGGKMDVLLSVDGTRRRAHIAAHSATNVAASGGGDFFTLLTGLDVLDFPPSSDPQKINTTSVRPTDNLDVFGASAEVNWKLGGAKLKSITAYRKMDDQTAADFDGTLAIYNDQEVNQQQNQFSQELQLSGSGESLKWIGGAYYLKEDIDEAIKNYFYTYYAFLPYGSGVTTTNHLQTTNFAVYGQASYNLTEKLSLTAGARWTHEAKDATLGNADLPTPFNVSNRKSWSNLSPRVGIEYQATDDVMLYASATRGFKSGSFNGRPAAAAQFTSYDPEKVSAYELGMKSQWLDNRVRLNAAGFWTQYKDIQLLTVGVDVNGDLFFPVNNAGDADIKGLEIELQARPTEALMLFGSLGYADEDWKKIAPVAFVTKATRLPGLSHRNVNLGAQYEMPLANFGSFIVGGDYSSRSSYFQTTINSPFEKEDGYSMVNAYFIIEPRKKNWQLKFWCKNLTDSKYIAWAQDLIAIGDSHTTVWFGRPREYGVTLRANF